MRPTPAPPERLNLALVLEAMADPIRLHLIGQLSNDVSIACGEFDSSVSKSTLTYHFKKLREAGIIVTMREGTRAINTLRKKELDAAFPGLIDCILNVYWANPSSSAEIS